MTAQKIQLLLEALRAKNIHSNNEWVTASCVLAPWTHAHGKDTNPSFGIKIGNSYWSCFVCGGGSLEELVQVMEFHSKGDSFYNFKTCHSLLDEEEDFLSLPAYGENTFSPQTFHAWPEYWLSTLQSLNDYSESWGYLAGRGVSNDEMVEYSIRYDVKRKMVVFPYFTAFGHLAGARGRSILDVQTMEKYHFMKHYDYTCNGYNNCKLVWYGEGVLNLPGPVCVVEGQFDLIKTRKAYKKTVANLTSRPSYPKMLKLTECPFIIQLPDSDAAGEASIEAYARICKSLGIKHKVLKLDSGAKDPAECSVDYLKDKIEELL